MQPKGRRERIALLSDPERRELEGQARLMRFETRKEALQLVTEAVFSYFEETQRHSGAHGARLKKAEDHLCEVIKQAAEDIKAGPVTDDELVVVMAALDAKRI